MARGSFRWRTRFGSWVQRYTVIGVARALASAGDPICTETVYKWVAGVSVPRPVRAVAMARLSAGDITIEDIYSHRGIVVVAREERHGSGSKTEVAR